MYVSEQQNYWLWFHLLSREHDKDKWTKEIIKISCYNDDEFKKPENSSLMKAHHPMKDLKYTLKTDIEKEYEEERWTFNDGVFIHEQKREYQHLTCLDVFN